MGARSMPYGQCVKPTRILINGEEKEFLFQQDIAPFLRALGYAYSTSEINRLCAPAGERSNISRHADHRHACEKSDE
jgi:hypothetical protein